MTGDTDEELKRDKKLLQYEKREERNGKGNK